MVDKYLLNSQRYDIKTRLKKKHTKEKPLWDFLAVQWLGLGSFTAVARVQSLVGELRSYKLRSAAKKKKTPLNNTFYSTLLPLQISVLEFWIAEGRY